MKPAQVFVVTVTVGQTSSTRLIETRNKTYAKRIAAKPTITAEIADANLIAEWNAKGVTVERIEK